MPKALTSFPFLQPHEFRDACRELCGRWRRRGGGGGGDVWVEGEEKEEEAHLVITQVLASPPRASEDASEDDDEIPDDEDRDAVVAVPAPAGPLVRYEVLLSATYRVPVLWVVAPAGEWVYEALVPRVEGVRGVGILGAVGMGNHPLTDRPAYFVHPCNTTDAMREVCRGREGGVVGLEEYLVVWLGLVGGAVGLWVPAEVVAEKG